MTTHNFYRAYEALTKEERFKLIESTLEPTSLFVIFQLLGQVRNQKRYFEEREKHLLQLAQMGFNNLKKNG